jgi:hypothetical protein
MKLCADSGGGEELDNLFSSLSLEQKATPPIPSLASPHLYPPTGPSAAFKPPPAKAASSARDPSTELSLLLSAMRKLREAMVATHRRDYFAQRAYIFIVQAAILVRRYESYHPALLYLLTAIHPRTPLPEPELHELLGYRILDLACRLRDLAGAYAVKAAHGYADRRVEGVLRALAADDWVRFWRLKRAVDGRQARLMELAEEDVRVHVLKCLGRSYMHADREYVERSTGASWDELVKKYGCGWEWKEDTDMIIIRKPKAKAG